MRCILINGLCSICCVSYNHSKFINFAIDSFLNQTYKNIEILALDDGSTDNSVDILYELKNKTNISFTIISQENSGNIGGNFNKLLNLAKGEFVLFISLDDAITDNFIEEQIAIMQNDSNVIMAGTTIPYVIDDNNNIQDNKWLLKSHSEVPDNPSAEFLLDLEYKKAHSVFIQGCIFQTDFVKKIGGFDEDILADDIVLRTKLYRYIIGNNNYKLHIKNKSGFYYRVHSTNISKNSTRIIKLYAQYYYKYWFHKPAPKFLNSYFVEYCGSAKYEDILELIKSHDFFIKLILENPNVAANYLGSNNNNDKSLGYNYYTFTLPLFSLKKYKNSKTGKKYKQINFLGFKINF